MDRQQGPVARRQGPEDQTAGAAPREEPGPTRYRNTLLSCILQIEHAVMLQPAGRPACPAQSSSACLPPRSFEVRHLSSSSLLILPSDAHSESDPALTTAIRLG